MGSWNGRSEIVKGANKAVAALGDCLDITRFIGGVAQGFPQPGDGAVQTVIKVNKCIGRPQVLAQFFPSYEFSGSL
jgi:hypothetical protein